VAVSHGLYADLRTDIPASQEDLLKYEKARSTQIAAWLRDHDEVVRAAAVEESRMFSPMTGCLLGMAGSGDPMGLLDRYTASEAALELATSRLHEEGLLLQPPPPKRSALRPDLPSLPRTKDSKRHYVPVSTGVGAGVGATGTEELMGLPLQTLPNNPAALFAAAAENHLRACSQAVLRQPKSERTDPFVTADPCSDEAENLQIVCQSLRVRNLFNGNRLLGASEEKMAAEISKCSKALNTQVPLVHMLYNVVFRGLDPYSEKVRIDCLEDLANMLVSVVIKLQEARVQIQVHGDARDSLERDADDRLLSTTLRQLFVSGTSKAGLELRSQLEHYYEQACAIGASKQHQSVVDRLEGDIHYITVLLERYTHLAPFLAYTPDKTGIYLEVHQPERLRVLIQQHLRQDFEEILSNSSPAWVKHLPRFERNLDVARHCARRREGGPLRGLLRQEFYRYFKNSPKLLMLPGLGKATQQQQRPRQRQQRLRPHRVTNNPLHTTSPCTTAWPDSFWVNGQREERTKALQDIVNNDFQYTQHRLRSLQCPLQEILRSESSLQGNLALVTPDNPTPLDLLWKSEALRPLHDPLAPMVLGTPQVVWVCLTMTQAAKLPSKFRPTTYRLGLPDSYISWVPVHSHHTEWAKARLGGLAQILQARNLDPRTLTVNGGPAATCVLARLALEQGLWFSEADRVMKITMSDELNNVLRMQDEQQTRGQVPIELLDLRTHTSSTQGQARGPGQGLMEPIKLQATFFPKNAVLPAGSHSKQTPPEAMKILNFLLHTKGDLNLLQAQQCASAWKTPDAPPRKAATPEEKYQDHLVEICSEHRTLPATHQLTAPGESLYVPGTLSTLEDQNQKYPTFNYSQFDKRVENDAHGAPIRLTNPPDCSVARMPSRVLKPLASLPYFNPNNTAPKSTLQGNAPDQSRGLPLSNDSRLHVRGSKCVLDLHSLNPPDRHLLAAYLNSIQHGNKKNNKKFSRQQLLCLLEARFFYGDPNDERLNDAIDLLRQELECGRLYDQQCLCPVTSGRQSDGKPMFANEPAWNNPEDLDPPDLNHLIECYMESTSRDSLEKMVLYRKSRQTELSNAVNISVVRNGDPVPKGTHHVGKLSTLCF
jgi:hypothetical protein